jgi:uncharacterized protein (DUF2062 family)
MLFKRRQPLPTHRRLGQIVWPRAGWRRTATYFSHRVGRLPGTPYKIAVGLACGVGISFTPFVGFHFLGAALLALLLRGNIVASAVGTVAGNPWTFPIIWFWTFKLGRWTLSLAGVEVAPSQHFNFTFSYIVENFYSIFIPMLVGGVPTGLAVGLVSYLVTFRAVTGYQATRRRRLRKKARRRQEREGRATAGARSIKSEEQS